MSDVYSRRQFISTGVKAGFALAVLPTAAWAISTSADGIEAGPISIPVDGGEMPGYRAMPKGAGPFPAVIIVHEIFGVHEYIQDLCRRMAKEGYLAVAPYLYSRLGDVTQIKETPDILKVVAKAPQKQVWSDLDKTTAWIVSTGKAKPGALAMTGFCWGGSYVWTYSAHNPAVRAGVAWYGKLGANPNVPAGTQSPLDLVSQLKTPVLGLYGGKDQGIPLEDVEKMRTALKKTAKSKSEIAVYDEAGHGFHADYRPSYHEASAKDGWSRMLKWFKDHGVS